MKRILTLLILLICLTSWGQHSTGMPNIYDQTGLRKGWDEGISPYVIKFFDLSYRYNLKSNYTHNPEVVVYPITLIRKRKFPIDIGIGGGLSISNKSTYGYGKLYLARFIYSKDKSYYSNTSYRLGIGGYSDFLFGNKSQRFGMDLINTFPITYTMKARVLLGPSYHTLEKAWKLNIGISIAFEDYHEPVRVKKPVIYAYSDDTVQTSISFNFEGPLTFVYPAYQDQWNVTVLPNNNIIDNKTGNSYPYLFWEGDYQRSMIPDPEEGFVVQKDEMVAFLEKKLTLVGLNNNEKTDFITFWGPQLTEDQYVVKFIQQEDCDAIATYSFTAAPENFLRLYVTFEPVYGTPKLVEPTLSKIDRGGFTIVEWGGMILPNTLVNNK